MTSMRRWQAPFKIVIGRRNFLVYLVLPYRQRAAFMAPGSDLELDRINAAANQDAFAGARADYDAVHAYDGDAQTEYPTATLVSEIWPGQGYGRALDVGAGSGYFTERIARHATSVVAIEPVEDLQRVITERCRKGRLTNVEIVGAPVLEAAASIPERSIDTAFVLSALHHFHRREDVFRMLGRLVAPGGRLFIVEPHHNIRRVLRVVDKYRRIYRPRRLWTHELHWGTHQFLTVSEMRWLCRIGGFEDVRIVGHWLPGLRRLFGDDLRRRCAAERVLGRLPGLRHIASQLALEARRSG